MGDQLVRKAAWALLWPVWCVVAAAVPLGVSLLSLRLDQDAWRENEHGLVLVVMLADLFFYMGMILVYLFVRDRWTDDSTGIVRWVLFFAGVVVVIVCSVTAVGVGDRDVEQQVLHDRGVTVTGVVTGIRTYTSDSGAPRQDGVYVRLRDGASFSVDGEPRVGSTVQVTTDSLGKVNPRLGGRPTAPTRQTLKVLIAVLAIGHVMEASITCGPLTGPVRRRASHDADPVGHSGE